MEIVVNGTVSNNGVYTIDTVTATTITLIIDDSLTNETTSNGVLTNRNTVKLQFTNTFDTDILLRFIARRWMSYDFLTTPPPPPFIMVLGVFDPSDEGTALGSQYISDSGIDTWTESTAINPVDPNFYTPTGLAYKSANGTWVATSTSTSAVHAYSTDDGATWTVAARVDFMASRSVAYNPTADRWVSAGNSGQIQYSDDDGVTWVNGANTPRVGSIFGSSIIYDVIWSPANNLWYCCTSNNEVGTSADGSTWAIAASEPGGASSLDLNCLWTVGSRLFAGQEDSGGTGGVVFYSDDDGATWNTPTSSGIGSSADIDNIGYDGSGVLMATATLNNNGNLLRSTDNGLNWTTEATGIAGTQQFADIKYDSQAGVWILVGGVQTVASKIWTSPTGLNGTWTEQENGTGTDGWGQILTVIGGKATVLPE
jgi:hypothetical protein